MSQQTRADWTQAITKRELAKSLAKKRSKFGATKVEIDGLVFDSKKEANRWRELVLMQAAGQITDLRRQKAFALLAYVERPDPFKFAQVGNYIADFTYQRDGRTVVEDVKSPATRRLALYRLKAKILAWNYGIEIQEV